MTEDVSRYKQFCQFEDLGQFIGSGVEDVILKAFAGNDLPIVP